MFFAHLLFDSRTTYARNSSIVSVEEGLAGDGEEALALEETDFEVEVDEEEEIEALEEEEELGNLEAEVEDGLKEGLDNLAALRFFLSSISLYCFSNFFCAPRVVRKYCLTAILSSSSATHMSAH